jgi:hypothetical protein
MKKGKTLLYALCGTMALLLMVVMCICFIPVSRKIDSAMTGIQCRNSDASGQYEEKKIQVHGIYKHYLFRNKPDSFIGKFSIEGYPMTEEFESQIFVLPIEIGANPLNYVDFSNSEDPAHLYAFGVIVCKPFLTEFLVRISEPLGGDGAEGKKWSEDNGLMIVAPANNRQKAIEKAKELYKDFSLEWK